MGWWGVGVSLTMAGGAARLGGEAGDRVQARQAAPLVTLGECVFVGKCVCVCVCMSTQCGQFLPAYPAPLPALSIRPTGPPWGGKGGEEEGEEEEEGSPQRDSRRGDVQVLQEAWGQG